MDNYPHHLAPEFDEGGGVATPFEEWWLRVQSSFPAVPEEVAREWLHRHWGHSPYRHLRSTDYRFDIEVWAADRLLVPEIRYRLDRFAESLDYRVEHAAWVLSHPPAMRSWVANYMLEHHNFPSRPVLLDNRDGHLVGDAGGAAEEYPLSYILIEGHNRLEYATYLAGRGLLERPVEFWVMTRA